MSVALTAVVLLTSCAPSSGEAADSDKGTPSGGSASTPPAAASTPAETSTDGYLGLPVEPATSAHVLSDHAAGGMLLAHRATHRLWVGGADGLWWVDPLDESVHQVDAKAGVGVFARGRSLYRAAYYAGDVARYDVPDTPGSAPQEVARVKAPAPLYGLANGDGVWVSDHTGGRLLHLASGTLARRAVLQLGPRSGGYHHALAGLTLLGSHDLWVISERDQRLYDVDTRTSRVAGHIDLDARPTDQLVAAGGGRLLVMLSRAENPSHADLEVIDTTTGKSLAQVVAHDDAALQADTADLLGANPVVIDGQVWVPADEHLVHLDPGNQWRPDRVLSLPVPGLVARFATIGFGSLWVYSDLPAPTIVRVPLGDLR